MSATVVYKWRVLLRLLPQLQRKQHIVHVLVESLRAHRASGMPDAVRLLHSAGGKRTSSGRQKCHSHIVLKGVCAAA